jgi:hypothetical protein
MKKAQRLSQQLDELEREYRAVLTKALTDCARGRWGLFGHNEHLIPVENPPELDELRDLAQTINRLRKRIGEVPFPLHQEFESMRGRAGANDPGEPKQAQAWLRRLEID